jgi:hypothetical protein
MRHPKIEIIETLSLGKGLRAAEALRKNELVADWTDGKVYVADSCTRLPSKEIADHAIQFETHKWIDTAGPGRYSNHSCEPNCGIEGRFRLVAMRDIRKGEWLTWDYEMTEDSDWQMECRCGTPSCRRTIGAYRNMPQAVREKYAGYISEWLVEKYG